MNQCIRFLLQLSGDELYMQVSFEYCNSLSLLLLSTPSAQNAAGGAGADVAEAVFDQSTPTEDTCSDESLRPVDGSGLTRWTEARCAGSVAVLSGNVSLTCRAELLGGSSNGR